MTNHTLESQRLLKNEYKHKYSLTCYTGVKHMLAFIANTHVAKANFQANGNKTLWNKVRIQVRQCS